MAWAYLLVASVIEIGWAIGLKHSAGFTRPIPSLLVLVGILISFALMARAIRAIPIGTAYAVFVGIGAGGTGFAGILLLGEPAGIARILCIVSIVVGVVGLKLFGETSASSAPDGTARGGASR